MKQKPLSLEEYGISAKRYKELKGFCEQYPEWKEELKYNVDTIKSKQITDMPLPPHRNSDATGDLAVKRKMMSDKCKIIETCMIKACKGDKGMYEAMMKSICLNVPFYDIESAFCSRATFVRYRRRFFVLLDEKKD